MTDVLVEGWYLHYRDDNANSNKFYFVTLTETGVVGISWGRVGSNGQHQVSKADYTSAKALAMRQVFAKQSKGYKMVHEGLKFTLDPKFVTDLCVDKSRMSVVLHAFNEVANKSGFGSGDQESVFRHYEDLVNRATALMDQASDPSMTSRRLEQLDDALAGLEEVWEGLASKHDEAAATISLTRAMVASKLLNIPMKQGVSA